MVEAFAAVTVPSLVNAGRSELILSILTFLYSSSSLTTTGSPRRCGTSTGITSSANLFFSQALADRSYEVLANSSCSSREKLYSRSEEHTSELQSRGHLVCRLLLEKKKKSKIK